MSKILCVANDKGGVGKTFFAAHLADYLSANGSPPAIVDLDHRGSSTILRYGFPDVRLVDVLVKQGDAGSYAVELELYRAMLDSANQAAGRPVLVDFGAGAFRYWAAWFHGQNMAESFRTTGHTFVWFIVVDSTIDSAEFFTRNLPFLSHYGTVILVRNFHKGSAFQAPLDYAPRIDLDFSRSSSVRALMAPSTEELRTYRRAADVATFMTKSNALAHQRDLFSQLDVIKNLFLH
jgi:hypothetical protein